MIYIYYAYLSKENHENLIKKEFPDFPFDFVEKLKRYRKWQDVQLSLLGRVLLFKGIKKHYKLNLNAHDIKYNQYNKPFFEGNQIYFNISHSAEIVVCAITDKVEIGVDIEKIYEIDLNNFRRNMTNGEWNKVMLSNNRYEAFFDYWTQKEAAIKTNGRGLSIKLKSFEITENLGFVKNKRIYLDEIRIDKKYKCYVAYKMPIKLRVKSIEIKVINDILSQK